MADNFYKKRGIFDEDRSGFAFREVFTPTREGPLPPRPSGKGGPSINQGAAVVSSVWSSSDAAANGMTLSNGGKTVTGSGAAAWGAVRGSISQTTGKLYCEFKIGSNIAINDPTHQIQLGLASSGFNIGSYLGSSNYSFADVVNFGTLYVSAGFSGGSTPLATGLSVNDVLMAAIDFGAGKVWLGLNNTWSGGSPGGSGQMANFTPATVGALFPAIALNGATGVVTLQPTAASQTYAPPAGFSAWDGGVAPPPTSVWSSTDASANGMTLSNGGKTVTPSGAANNQSVRGTTSHNTGKWYIEVLASGSIITNYMMFGFADATFNATNNYLGSNGVSEGMPFTGTFYGTTGFTNTNTFALTPAANDVFAIAVDFNAGKIWMARNNVWAYLGDPVAGTGQIINIAAPALGAALFPGMTYNGTGQGVWTLQPTAASQTYAPPAGFSAWG